MMKCINSKILENQFFENFENINTRTALIKDQFSLILQFKKRREIDRKNEDYYVKVCWREVFRFNKFISNWKIINNHAFLLKGVRSKRGVIKKKKTLKKNLLRTF